ncbi:MAG TPA: hypothetical protein VI457_05330, partial [Methylococcaceae bacterium]|nr:hypothetical protein [Methylococcaceae bacterium]
MTNVRFKKNLWLASALAAALQGPVASAACLSGTLGAEAGAVDVHPVSCPSGTDKLAYRVRNATASSPKLSAQASKDAKAANTTDSVAGDASFSPVAFVDEADGSGTYNITVDKSSAAAAPVSYRLFYQCQTATSALEDAAACDGQIAPLTLTPPSIALEAAEGEIAANTLQIEQGCYSGGAARPVIAYSALFPADDTNADSFRSDNDAPVDLADVIANGGGLAGLMAPAQDKSTFSAQTLKLDSSGKTIGLQGTKGRLPTDLTGQVPFVFTAPNFRAESCARRLLVKIAVAEVCRRTDPPAVGDVNLWIPNQTTKFSNGALIPEADNSARSGVPATLTVNRTTPLDAGCNGGYDVTVWPAD